MTTCCQFISNFGVPFAFQGSILVGGELERPLTGISNVVKRNGMVLTCTGELVFVKRVKLNIMHSFVVIYRLKEIIIIVTYMIGHIISIKKFMIEDKYCF